MLPPVIGHRGAAAQAPENTMAGFRRAVGLGVSWVELDVHVTADGRLAVIHDDTLDRTTNGRGRVGAKTAGQLAMLDAGGWFDPRYRGEPVPMLDQALDILVPSGIGVNIEIKPARGRVAETIGALKAALADLQRAGAPPILVSSFDRTALVAAHERLPELPRALLAEKLPRDWRAVARALECVSIHLNRRHIRPDQAQAVRQAGLELAAYTVNDPAEARKLWSWGVNALFSDAPDLLLAERRKAQ